MHHRALTRARRGLAAGLAVGLLAACTSGTPSASVADAAGDPLCTKVAAHWPTTVASKTRTDVEVSGSPANTVAGWGDPAIIARCGVASPGPSTECIEADDVDWVMTSLSDGKRFVTYGRVPAIEVLVPSAYSPEPLVLGAFDAAAGQVPQDSHRCS